MYNKVISKIRCHSPNRKNTPVRNYNLLYYIATREGVDLMPLKSEMTWDEIYTRYIHERPRSNGLFGNIDTSDVNSVCSDIRKLSETCCVYRGILSLSEEDAKELGFLDKSSWNDFLTLSMPEIAETLGIPAPEMTWIAAFHNEPGHPHVHYMLWDDSPYHVQTPFISIQQQHRCRELFSGRFFAKEREVLSQQKTAVRKTITMNTKEQMQTTLQKLVSDVCKQPSFKTLRRVNQQFLDASSIELLKLAEQLPKTGSIKYAYLPPELKKQADQVVQHMLTKSELKEEYDSFLNYHKQIAETYSPTNAELRVAILKGKEDIDRRLANVVLRAAHELRKKNDIYYALLNTHLPSYQNLLKNGITNDTIAALCTEAEAGNSQAAYLLGRIYDDPEGNHHNPDQAIRYYTEAANSGNTAAKSILGSKYLWGKDVKRDEDLGRKHLHEAQEEGDEYAKAAEAAYNSYHAKQANDSAMYLMSDLLYCLCTANHTRCPSSVYRPESIDKNNKKARKEAARKHPHKRSEEIMP